MLQKLAGAPASNCQRIYVGRRNPSSPQTGDRTTLHMECIHENHHRMPALESWMEDSWRNPGMQPEEALRAGGGRLVGPDPDNFKAGTVRDDVNQRREVGSAVPNDKIG
jgi:hypothetical protein